MVDGAKNFVSFGYEAVLAASRVNELALVNEVLAKQAGIANEEVRKEVDEVRKMGIEAAVAEGIVASLIRAQLDFAK